MTARGVITKLYLLAGLCLMSGMAVAESFQVPRLTGPVVDNGGFLSPAAERQIAAALMTVKRKGGGTEIGVLTVPDLGGLTIEQASIQVADAWRLGSDAEDNGVLLLVAKKERRVRIEVGQGLEGVLTDAHSKRIIDETIVPLFRSGDTEQAILLGVYQVAKRTNPELDLKQIFGAQASQWKQQPRSRGRTGWGAIIPLIFILLFIFGGRGRGMGGGLFTGLLLGSMMGGGRRYGGGGFGGGGFGGGGFGGGGGFSGGGASGGW